MKHYSIDYSLVYEASCDLSRAYEKLLSDDMEIAKVLIGYAKDKLDRFTSQENLVEDYYFPDPLIKLNEDADTGEPQGCKECPFSYSTEQLLCKRCEHNKNV